MSSSTSRKNLQLASKAAKHAIATELVHSRTPQTARIHASGGPAGAGLLQFAALNSTHNSSAQNHTSGASGQRSALISQQAKQSNRIQSSSSATRQLLGVQTNATGRSTNKQRLISQEQQLQTQSVQSLPSQQLVASNTYLKTQQSEIMQPSGPTRNSSQLQLKS